MRFARWEAAIIFRWHTVQDSGGVWFWFFTFGGDHVAAPEHLSVNQPVDAVGRMVLTAQCPLQNGVGLQLDLWAAHYPAVQLRHGARVSNGGGDGEICFVLP